MPHDLVIGGVFVSPFVAYAAASFAVLLALRPFFVWLRLGRFVANPPLAEAGIYVCILAVLVLAFH